MISIQHTSISYVDIVYDIEGLVIFDIEDHVMYIWFDIGHVLHWADIERWHLRSRPLVQHWNALPLHAAVWSQTDGFKGTEEDQRNGLV